MTEENTKKDDAEVKTEAKTEKRDNRGPRKPRQEKKTSDLAMDMEERVVAVNRVAKVVKGGRRFSFSALMIVGDMKGKVGYGLGKAKEVPDAIRKASQEAQRNMVHVPIENGTIPHRILGEFDAGKILFQPASEGTGIKAAGACRTILELAGVKNVLTKSLRGSNPHNVVKATFVALRNLRSPEQIAKARGVDAKGLRIKI
jgi:small subunit ribosomal protein S5